MPKEQIEYYLVVFEKFSQTEIITSFANFCHFFEIIFARDGCFS